MAGITNAFADQCKALCPLCGRDLKDSDFSEGSWACRCGEVIPEGFEVSPRMHPPSSNAQAFTAELESAVRQGAPKRKRT